MVNIALLILPNAMASSLTLPLEMLNAVNDQLKVSKKTPARTQLIGISSKPVHSAGGLGLQPQGTIDDDQHYQLIVLPTRWRHPLKGLNHEAALFRWLQRQYAQGATLCTVGTGSYLLAEAGLLNDRPATTHWHYFDDFAERYPAVQLIRNYLITEAERLYCAGSVNSIADLIVHIIGELWGTQIAYRVERQFSPEIRRPFHAHAYRVGQTDLHRDEAIANAQSYIRKHFAQPLTVPALAQESGLTERTFQRRFRAATGQSALDYLNTLRLRTARELLQQSNLAITEIAQTVGIAEPSYFSRLFRRQFSESPVDYRKKVRAKLFTATVSENPRKV